MFLKMFGMGGGSDPEPDKAEGGVAAPTVIDITEDGQKFLLVTLEMPGTPRFIRRRFHIFRPRSRLMAQADTLEALNAYEGEPLGEFERLDAEGAVQQAMIAARAAFLADQPD